MQIKVVAVGRVKEKEARVLCDDYLKRIARYCRVQEVEVKNDDALKAAVATTPTVVALQVWGKAHTSEKFSTLLERWGSTGKGEITFIIGGAEGIPKSVSEGADPHISLSSMTLPHRLARLILLEHIYRGFSILRGEPYAREG
jgi:23S rRNA (pseudouridine1915-N3)-methyltransferase